MVTPSITTAQTFRAAFESKNLTGNGNAAVNVYLSPLRRHTSLDIFDNDVAIQVDRISENEGSELEQQP